MSDNFSWACYLCGATGYGLVSHHQCPPTGDPQMTEVVTPTIQATIQTYLMCEKVVEELTEKLKDANRILGDAEQRVLEALLADPEQGAIEYAGRKWGAEIKTRITPDEGCSDLVVKWIESHGGESLVTPTMHWKRRNAFLDDTLIDDNGNVDIPEELAGLVKVYDQPVLTKRKVAH